MNVSGHEFSHQPDLDGWCNDRVADWLIARDYKRMLARNVVTTDGVTEWSYKCKPADLERPCRIKSGETTTYRLAILGDHPGTRIVNDFTPAELTAHIAAMVAAEKAARAKAA